MSSAHENHYDSNTRGESSWSMFQLNRAGGLGNVFERQTGLDVRNPKSIPAIADFVARHIASGKSLSPWRGFHGPRNWDNHWGNMGYSPEHKSFAPPPKRHAPIHIENVHYLDGREIARNTVRHIVHDARHPTSAPFHDGSREWTPPDSGLMTT